MDALARNFNKVYPGLQTMHFQGRCSVDEPKNVNTAKFQQINLTGFDGYIFPHELMGKTSSFATSANHNGVLNLDCDGVILFKHKEQKYILLCELKSSYNCDEIVHAKDQLIGSSVKIKSLLNSLQGFDKLEYKMLGLIVSFEPTDEQITNISKYENPKSSFAIKLQADKKYMMPATKTNKFFHPLEIGDFYLYYIAVPDRKTIYTIDIKSVFGL